LKREVPVSGVTLAKVSSVISFNGWKETIRWVFTENPAGMKAKTVLGSAGKIGANVSDV